MPIRGLIIILGGVLFAVSTVAHIFAKVRLRPREDSDLDEYYFELEDHHPGLNRYNTWCRATLTGVIVSMLLMFLALVL